MSRRRQAVPEPSWGDLSAALLMVAGIALFWAVHWLLGVYLTVGLR